MLRERLAEPLRFQDRTGAAPVKKVGHDLAAVPNTSLSQATDRFHAHASEGMAPDTRLTSSNHGRHPVITIPLV